MLPGGEAHKTLANVAVIIDALVAARLNRDGMVLALGGGVIGDIAGFAAYRFKAFSQREDWWLDHGHASRLRRRRPRPAMRSSCPSPSR